MGRHSASDSETSRTWMDSLVERGWPESGSTCVDDRANSGRRVWTTELFNSGPTCVDDRDESGRQSSSRAGAAPVSRL